MLTSIPWEIGSSNYRDEGCRHATAGAPGGVSLDSQRPDISFHDGVHDGEYKP
jgi:hypothetical protein